MWPLQDCYIYAHQDLSTYLPTANMHQRVLLSYQIPSTTLTCRVPDSSINTCTQDQAILQCFFVEACEWLGKLFIIVLYTLANSHNCFRRFCVCGACSMHGILTAEPKEHCWQLLARDSSVGAQSSHCKTNLKPLKLIHYLSPHLLLLTPTFSAFFHTWQPI